MFFVRSLLLSHLLVMMIVCSLFFLALVYVSIVCMHHNMFINEALSFSSLLNLHRWPCRIGTTSGPHWDLWMFKMLFARSGCLVTPGRLPLLNYDLLTREANTKPRRNQYSRIFQSIMCARWTEEKKKICAREMLGKYFPLHSVVTQHHPLHMSMCQHGIFRN